MEDDFFSNNEDPSRLKYEIIGGVKIYEARTTVRKRIRLLAERHLKSKFKEGVYKGIEDCNSIYKFLFEFYKLKIDTIITNIVDQDFFTFFLFQFEQSSKINKLFYENKLSNREWDFWKFHGPTIRQAIDYLLEIGVYNRKEETYLNQFDFNNNIALDELWICTKQAIDYANLSNNIAWLKNQNPVVEIKPYGEDFFINNGFSENFIFKECFEKYLNLTSSSKYGIDNELINDTKLEYLNIQFSFLNEPLIQTIGITLKQFYEIISQIIYSNEYISDYIEIPLTDKKALFSSISINFNIDIKILDAVFDEITISSGKKSSIDIWNYNRENRFSFKPFLEVNINNRTFLTWSPTKLKNFLDLFANGLIFKKIPKGWNSKSVELSLSKYSNFAGKWFENLVVDNLALFGIIGQKYERTIFGIKIPKYVGGLDYFGYFEEDNCIVLLECKYINSSFESRGFRQEQDKFIEFEKKLMKKTGWILENYSDIISKMDLNANNLPSLKIAFVTYYNSIANCVLEEFEATTLKELCFQLKQKKRWPLQKKTINPQINYIVEYSG